MIAVMVEAAMDEELIRAQVANLFFFVENEVIESCTPTEAFMPGQSNWPLRRTQARTSHEVSDVVSPTVECASPQGDAFIAEPRTPLVLRDGTVLAQVKAEHLGEAIDE
eukprot:3208174-Heterocapsa_arctica.AAC.1